MTRPPLTGGQRASAALTGLLSHTLFSIGWFGLGFVLLAGALGGVLQALLSQVDVEALQHLFASAGSIIWIVIIVFGVGSLFFVVLAIALSPAMLRRGEVHRPWGVTILSVIVSAVIDFPIFLLAGWLSHVATASEAGLVFLPPLFSLVLVLVTGALVWLWMAHVLRAKAPEEGPLVAVPMTPAASREELDRAIGAPTTPAVASSSGSGPDHAAGEAADAVEQPR